MPSVPIRIVPASPALPALATSTLLEPVVRFLPAFRPMATLVDAGGVEQGVDAGGDVVGAGRVGAAARLGRWRRCWRRCVLERSA